MALNLTRLPTGAALGAILALALALRVAGGLWWQSRLLPDQRFEFGDSDAYWVLGQNMAAGKPFEYGSPDARIFRMPGYPALLAALFRLFGPDVPVLFGRLLSAGLGTLAVAAVYWLAKTLFDRRTGLVAALAAACYPGAIAMSVVVLSEAPFCPLYLAQLAAWTKSWQAAEGTTATSPSALRQALLWAVVSGLLGGLGALMRPDWLLFVPFAALAGLFFVRQRARHLQLSLVMMLVTAGVMTPWWWRNARVVGHFVPTTLQVGASLYDGLNPKADGGSNMSFVSELVAKEQEHPSLPDEPFEYRLDRRMWNAALDWAAGDPRRVAELAGIKFLRMWNLWPNDPQHRGRLARLVTAVTFAPAVTAALAGIWLTRRQLWPAALCWLPAVYLTLLHLIFVSSIRYREPPMFGLLVFTAAFVTRGSRPSPVH
ncbi:MAG TPA: glycosyltransferase family 39 protein [Pirellulales bacterium]|jgi:4-amino-4-deoxy-L-arabinose transferase-like glycosyltransferase|nr:glycosyltransferase family 39 protein [Pirellulales bacterium]